VQIGKYLEEPDRALRQETWTLVVNRRLEEREKFEEQFDQLLKLRGQIARTPASPITAITRFASWGGLITRQPTVGNSTKLWKRKSCP